MTLPSWKDNVNKQVEQTFIAIETLKVDIERKKINWNLELNSLFFSQFLNDYKSSKKDI